MMRVTKYLLITALIIPLAYFLFFSSLAKNIGQDNIRGVANTVGNYAVAIGIILSLLWTLFRQMPLSLIGKIIFFLVGPFLFILNTLGTSLANEVSVHNEGYFFASVMFYGCYLVAPIYLVIHSAIFFKKLKQQL